ncbi:hypothetical protein D3C81_1712660 [compost metagenome]
MRDPNGGRICQRAQEIARGMRQDGAAIGGQFEARPIQDLHAGFFHEAEIQRVVEMVQGV